MYACAYEVATKSVICYSFNRNQCLSEGADSWLVPLKESEGQKEKTND